MNIFQENLKSHFQELYTRLSLAQELVNKATKEQHIMELSQGIALINMRIDAGLKFL